MPAVRRDDEPDMRVAGEAGVAKRLNGHERVVRRVWDTLEFATRFGVPVDALAGWGRIVSPGARPEERRRVASDLKAAIKARFEVPEWQRFVQPIHDRLRALQRDALVAHVIQRNGFTSIEQLYEYFLVDPGMEPVVRTSRIRLAIGSLQLLFYRTALGRAFRAASDDADTAELMGIDNRNLYALALGIAMVFTGVRHFRH